MIATTRANPDRTSSPVGAGAENAELRAAIDAELAALPEMQRATVVLCDLRGKTRAEAAAELGRPEGTVAAWLARGRKALAARLARRGLALPAAGLLAAAAPAPVSARLTASAVAALLGRAASPAAVALADGVLRGLSSGAAKLGAVLVAAGALVAAVATAGAWRTGDEPKPAAASPAASAAVPPAKADEPPGAAAWKETKVLKFPGRLPGSVAYSRDGETLFIGGTPGFVHAYDAATWKRRWEHQEPTNFTALAGAPDGKTLAVTFKDGDRRWGVRMLNAATGKPEIALDEGGVPGVVDGPEPLAVGFFPDVTLLDAQGSTSHKLIFGTAAGYVVKTWVDPEKASTITSSTVAAGKKPADEYAVPLAVDPAGKRAVVTGPIDKDTGKNILWAWSAGSGEPNKLLEGHKATVTSAAWSKDGKLIATGDADGTVIVWDAKTFKEKSRVKLGGRVAAVAVSHDGSGVAAAVVRSAPGKDTAGEVFVWPAASPPKKPQPLSSHLTGSPFRGVASVAFSPDGKQLASCFANFTLLTRTGILVGHVRIFAVAPVPPAKPPAPAAKFVGDVSFSPDGTKYLTVSGGRVNVLDAATGKQLYSVPGEAGRFTTDGKKLFVMGEKILECDPDSGKSLKSYDRPKTKWGAHLAAFSPDGKRFALHFGTHVRVYDSATGFEPVQLEKQQKQVGSFVVGGAAEQLLWSPDGKQLVAGGVLVRSGQMGMAGWEVKSGEQFYSFAGDFTDGPRAAAFSGDSKALAVGYKDRVDLWTGGLNPVKKLPTAGPVTALAISKGGTLLAAGVRMPILNPADKPPPVIGHKSVVQLFDTATLKEVKRFDGFEGVNHMAPTVLPVTALAFSPDGKRLLAGTGVAPFGEVPKGAPAGEVKLFDVADSPAKPAPAPAGRQWTDAAVLTDHGRLVNGVAVAPGGKSFAAATEGNVTCWAAATDKVLWKYRPADSATFALAYSPDGKHLCAATTADVVRLDAKTGKPDPWAGDNATWFGRVGAVAYNPSGESVAASDGYVTRVRRVGGREVVTFGKPPKGDAPARSAGVAWSKDGKRLALIPHEKKDGKWLIHAWQGIPWAGTDVPWGADSKVAFAGHDAPVVGVAWSKDGKVIASGDEKGTVILWDAATGKELWKRTFRGRDDTDGRVNALAISPADGTVAAAVSLGSGKGAERVALIGRDGKDDEQLMRAWHLPVSSVAWSEDGSFLVTGCGAAGRAIAQTEPAVGEVVVWRRKP
jgi:WD40 repeat protein